MMLSIKRLGLLMLPAVLMLLVAACGEDATPTSASAPDPTATSEPAPDPTATPEPDPTATPEPEVEVVPPPPGSQEFSWVPEFGPCPAPCVILDNFTVEDGKFELRIGDDINPDGLFGYPQGARIPTILPGGIVIGPIEVGTTMRFNTIRMSGSRSTKRHDFIIEGLGIAIVLEGNTQEPWEHLFDQVGEFAISSGDENGPDSPDEHGAAVIIVVDSSGGGGGAAAGPVTYVLDEFKFDDRSMELRLGDDAAFGYAAGSRNNSAAVPGPVVYTLDEFKLDDESMELRMGSEGAFTYEIDERINSADADILMYISLGDSIVFPDGLTSSSSRSTMPHFFTIDELGYDFEIPVGGAVEPGFTITPTEVGTYRIYDSAHPDAHGTATLEVRDPVACCDIVLIVNAGDTIVFPDGLTSSSSRSTVPHFFTIDALGYDIEIEVGGDVEPGFSITPTEPGSYPIYDSAHPDDHGKATLVVLESGAENAAPRTYVLDEFKVDDTSFEFRTGAEPALGFDAEARINSARTDLVITMGIGDTLEFPEGLTSSSSRSTKAHFFTIDAFGIDVEIPIGVRLQPVFRITPNQLGSFTIYCSAHPDEHANATINVVAEWAAVEEPAEEEPEAGAATTYTIDVLKFYDDGIELRMGPDAAWGYDGGQRIRSTTDPVVMTINLGDSIVLANGLSSSGGNSNKHFFTMDELGFDIPMEVNEDRDPGFTITPTSAGTFLIYDSSDAAVVPIMIVVTEAAKVYTIDLFKWNDERIELRMGPTAYWGYDARSRINTNNDESIVMTINAGDSIVFENGLSSAGNSTKAHFFTIDELGIDIKMEINEDTNFGYVLAPTEAGVYQIYDSGDAAVTGVTLIVLVPGGPPPADPVTYLLDEFKFDDTSMELRMGAEAAFGYDAGAEINSADGEIVITVNVRDTIVFPDGLTSSSSRSTTPHFFTIDELGFDFEIEVGGAVNAFFAITPTKAGTYAIYCSAHPDDHGSATLIVQ